jgi:thioredoxin reductase (NADPH)
MTVTSHEDDLIIGAGPIGLACAISGRRRGFDPLVIDAGAIVNSLVRYPIGMTFFTTPERLEIGGHPLVSAGAKATREEALKYYRGIVRTEEIRVRPYTRLVAAERRKGVLHCRLQTRHGEETLTCNRLVLAIGYFDHPSELGVPGEQLPHVSHYFDEPHLTAGLDVVIVGGKNSAIETALLCFRAGARVTLVYRRPELRPSVKYWLGPDFLNRVRAGEISARFGDEVVEITQADVATRPCDGPTAGITRTPADRVYLLTGYRPDFALLRSIGVELNDEGRFELDPETLETSVPSVHLAGSVAGGRHVSDIFIENGRFDGEKIFGEAASRARADAIYAATQRAVDE